MATPLQGYQQQVDPHSTTSTILGFGYETARWSTWRNPWFLERIGKEGWDPAGKGVMSWLDKKTGGLVNKVLAPLADEDYTLMNRAVAKIASPHPEFGVSRATKAASRTTRGWSGFGLNSEVDRTILAEETRLERNLLLGKRAKKIRGTLGKALGVDSEPEMARILAGRGAKRGFWHSMGVGSGRREAEQLVKNRVEAKLAAGGVSKYAAGVAGAGRLLRGANAAMWGYELGKLFMGGVKAVANIGAQSRMVPYATTGSGIQDNYMASTLRQSALMDMYSSEYGNRRQMGNEARFLHS